MGRILLTQKQRFDARGGQHSPSPVLSAQTVSEAHPASYIMGTGFKAAGTCKVAISAPPVL